MPRQLHRQRVSRFLFRFIYNVYETKRDSPSRFNTDNFFSMSTSLFRFYFFAFEQMNHYVIVNDGNFRLGILIKK